MKKILNSSDASLLHQLMGLGGWKVVIKVLDDLFAEKYSKLRKQARDSGYYKIQGGLDTIDEIKDRFNYKLDEEEQENG